MDVSRLKSYCVAAVLFTLLAAPLLASAKSYAPPPIPPIGWDDRLDPGLLPSPEAIVVAASRARGLDTEKVRHIWAKWDAKAVDRLYLMLDDPDWASFRRDTLRVLFLSPLPDVLLPFEQRMQTLAKADTLPQGPPDLMDIMGDLGRLRKNDALPLLGKLAGSSLPAVSNAALYGIAEVRSKEAVATLDKLYEGLPQQEKEKRRPYLDTLAGYVRAQEPMTDSQKNCGGKEAK